MSSIRTLCVGLAATLAGLVVAPPDAASQEACDGPPSNVALFEDQEDWGAANQPILDLYGIPYTVFGIPDIGTVDLSGFDKVVIAGNQSQTFYTRLRNNSAWINGWVEGGCCRVLEIHAADNVGGDAYWDAIAGLGIWDYTSDDVTAIEPDHRFLGEPVMVDPADLDDVGSSVHAVIDAPDPGWTEVVREDSSGLPALVEYGRGDGWVILTTMTVEYAWYYGHHDVNENLLYAMRPPGNACVDVVDGDRDGYDDADGDCDDFNPNVHPGAEEICDGEPDNDCDGVLDPADTDVDVDHYTPCGGDCDDADAAVHPGAPDVCDGVLDNDCDGETDLQEADTDGDGYAVCTGDCYDLSITVYPGAPEICDGHPDNNCDDERDPAEFDGDGDGYTPCLGDCDDASVAVYPGAPDVCDGIADNDCDGVDDPIEAAPDADGDGYTPCEGDCDDADPAVFPDEDGICFVGGTGLPTNVALFEESWDWGQANRPILALYGIPYTLFQADDMGVADLSGYDKVIIASNQDAAYYDALAANAEWFNDWVSAECHRVLEVHAADNQGGDDYWDGLVGLSVTDGFSDDLTIVDAGNRLVNSPVAIDAADLDGLSYSVHAWLEDDPDHQVVIKDEVTDQPVLVEFGWGDGWVIASTMTLEYAWKNNYHDTLEDLVTNMRPAAGACVDDGDGDDDGYLPPDDCDDGDAAVYPGAPEVCDGVDDNDCDGVADPAEFDADGDGATPCEGDCADDDAAVYPGAPDVCDGVLDNDCDGVLDASEADADGDGVTGCSGDCDDAAAGVYPGAPEVCDGAVDNDCSGDVDPAEADGDGDGASECDGDCDDGAAAVHPGAEEVCDGALDNDCDGEDDPAEVDTDLDGATPCAGDCDDGRADVAPGALEVCDDVLDNDCDGETDPAEVDADGDGYTPCTGDCDDGVAAVNPGAAEVCDGVADNDCDQFADPAETDADGDGWTPCAGDCDDARADLSPGAVEVCDGVDNDCDGTADEDVLGIWYADGDADGYGDPTVATLSCEAPGGYVADHTDCNDADAAFHPGAPESCSDPNDYDCDGAVTYVDADQDGVAACEDCDDANAAVFPGNSEACDGVDNDCDGAADEDAGTTWYADSDGDGYGDGATGVVDCETPPGTVSDGTDCNDADAAVHPGAAEACTDTVDLNCDGSISYTDADLDGFAACLECDDSDPAVNPGATEVCDGVDDDCDGEVDEGFDADADGFTTCGGDCDDSVATVNPGRSELCNLVDDDCDGVVDNGFDADADGTTTCGGDCNDADAATWPGAPESCEDPVDRNCDGAVGLVDGDGDGHAACVECNDADPAVHPGATEVCNGVDDDCNGLADDGLTTSTWYPDADGDGYGDSGAAADLCADPGPGYTGTGGDCNDTDAAWFPGAPEFCDDPNDYNCDGSVGFVDGDGDGFAACEECDDGDAAVNPGAEEVCNAADDDCDGVADEGFEDDGDGDGTIDCLDSCPGDPADDADGDGWCADQDVCPEDADPDQLDADGDGIGDACEEEGPPPGDDDDADDDAAAGCSGSCAADHAGGDRTGAARPVEAVALGFAVVAAARRRRG